MSRDEAIGVVVQQARQELGMTQSEVADALRAAGYKWSQATLWAIEKGERPLKLSEAADLAVVLRLPSVRTLLGTTTPLEEAQIALRVFDRQLLSSKSTVGHLVMLQDDLTDYTLRLGMDESGSGNPDLLKKLHAAVSLDLARELGLSE